MDEHFDKVLISETTTRTIEAGVLTYWNIAEFIIMMEYFLI